MNFRSSKLVEVDYKISKDFWYFFFSEYEVLRLFNIFEL
jgi:hypothetical protein